MNSAQALINTLENCPVEGVVLTPEQCAWVVEEISPSRFEFFVIMQKRSKGEIYPDLHKTDGKIYCIEEEALAALEADPELKPFRHVVKMWAQLAPVS